MIKQQIPKNTIKRLPVYLRILQNLELEGKETFNSEDFIAHMDINPAVLRKDLAYFGNLGVRGIGYSVSGLKEEITKLLGIKERAWETVIIGAGNIARALMKYDDFKNINLKIVAAFDSDTLKVGKSVSDVPILDIVNLEKFINEHDIKFAIITAPSNAVDQIVETLKKTKIRGIVNFSPRYVHVNKKKIIVTNINITARILTMLYYLKDLK